MALSFTLFRGTLIYRFLFFLSSSFLFSVLFLVPFLLDFLFFGGWQGGVFYYSSATMARLNIIRNYDSDNSCWQGKSKIESKFEHELNMISCCPQPLIEVCSWNFIWTSCVILWHSDTFQCWELTMCANMPIKWQNIEWPTNSTIGAVNSK